MQEAVHSKKKTKHTPNNKPSRAATKPANASTRVAMKHISRVSPRSTNSLAPGLWNSVTRSSCTLLRYLLPRRYYIAHVKQTNRQVNQLMEPCTHPGMEIAVCREGDKTTSAASVPRPYLTQIVVLSELRLSLCRCCPSN